MPRQTPWPPPTSASVRPVGRDRSLPERQAFHVAGPSGDGWMILAIHDSKQGWEQFRDGALMPRLQAGIDGGSAAPPRRRRSRSTTRSPPDDLRQGAAQARLPLGQR